MIKNNIKQKQKLNITCLHKPLHQQEMQQSPLPSFLNIRQSLTKATDNATKMLSASSAAPPAMEGVVVNSIIYSKPSFCSIVVDIAPEMGCMGEATYKKEQFIPPKITLPLCAGNPTDVITNLASAAAAAAANTTTTNMSSSDQDARFYMMCTTMNGVIHHQISEICDNLMAMGLFCDSQSECEDLHDDEDDDDDDDNDSLIEFAYEDESDMDDEDETDFYNPENNFEPKTANCDKIKKVRFNNKPEVHVMHTWNYAYRAARKGEWEMYARDRDRFKSRIMRAAQYLNPVLRGEHRQKIFESRFSNTTMFDLNQNVVKQVGKTSSAKDYAKIQLNKATKFSNQKQNTKKKKRKKRYRKKYIRNGLDYSII